MKSYFVRERIFALFGAASLVALAACEDKRVSQLDTGITRDSAVSVLASQIRPGSASDSFPNVYMREKFLDRRQARSKCSTSPRTMRRSRRTRCR